MFQLKLKTITGNYNYNYNYNGVHLCTCRNTGYTPGHKIYNKIISRKEKNNLTQYLLCVYL
jgi:hypothetical protein